MSGGVRLRDIAALPKVTRVMNRGVLPAFPAETEPGLDEAAMFETAAPPAHLGA